MALSKDIVLKLIADYDQAIAAQKALAKELDVSVTALRRAERAHEQQQKAVEAAAAKQKRAMQDVGRAATGFGLAMAAGLGVAVKAAMDWESSWAGVTKTVSGTPQQLAKVEQGLRGLARVLPATHTEIAAVAEAAGQLGVKTESVVDFTRTMINLGETTNLTADEAATSLAQLMNVMGTAPQDVDRLGAALVALGNDGASTEADIVKMTSYITGSAKLIGASESDVLALANTMTSLGINAERGGGVMTRTMQDIYSAVQEGGSQLDAFAKAAGMSAEEFARAFQADPVRAIGAFTDGLAAAKDRGENVVGILKDLGIVGTQDTAVLLQMASAHGMVNKNLDLGNKAWEENSALVQEAAKRYDTTAAKMEIARNNINEAGIEIGETLLPVLASVAGAVADVAQWFADLPGPVKDVLAALGSVAAVGGLAGGAFLLLAPRVMETFNAFKLLSQTSPRVAAGLKGVGKAAGIAGAVTALGYAVGALVDSMEPAPRTMEETTKALLGMGSSMESVDAMFKRGGADVWSDDINGLADAAKALTDPSLLNRLDDFGGSVGSVIGLGSSDGRAERAALIEQINGIGDALGLMVNNGSADLAAEQFDLLAAEWEKGGGTVDDLLGLMPTYQEALDGVANQQELASQSAQRQAQSTAQLAQDLDTAYGSLAGYAAALGLDEDATEDLIKKSQELGQSLADFIDPLGAYTSMLDEKAAAEEEAARKAAESAGAGADSWRDFVKDTGFSFDEYMHRLEEQVAAQANWQTNMLILAGRVSQGTLDELARMGPEGAPLVADLVNRSDAELDRFDDVTALRSKEATDAWGAQLTMAQPVLQAVAAKAGQGVVDGLAAKLQAGTITVADIARQYGISLAGGINPVLKALGKPTVRPVTNGQRMSDLWVGGYTGDGGKYEPKGVVHGGEYVLTKEQTSRLGIDRIEDFANNGYANGGFVTAADVPRPSSTAPFRAPISTPADATMQREYDELTTWLKANAGGTAGTGNLASGVAAMFATVKAHFPEARLNSGFRPGDPGYHGMGRAIDLGQIGRAGGNGHPYLASMNRWLHDTYGSNLKELIYDGAGDDRPDLKNGRPLAYNAATRAQHHNHVHVAMANGGVIREPIIGMGLRTGGSYSFGERGPETVTPGIPVGGSRGSVGGQVVINSPITFSGPVYGGDAMRRIAEDVVGARDAQLARNVRSSL